MSIHHPVVVPTAREQQKPCNKAQAAKFSSVKHLRKPPSLLRPGVNVDGPDDRYLPLIFDGKPAALFHGPEVTLDAFLGLTVDGGNDRASAKLHENVARRRHIVGFRVPQDEISNFQSKLG